MRISIVTPNYNGAGYLKTAIRSVISQRCAAFELEYIVIDGGSDDGSREIVNEYKSEISRTIFEADRGPADAVNKGLRAATGDVIGWINSDDFYYPGSFERVLDVMRGNETRALCFGHCPIVNESGEEIRKGITRFKESFFPFSSRFAIQCINYVSQPAMFFRRSAMEKAGMLRDDLKCAWDYDFILRLWRHGGAARVGMPPLAAFRWHEKSISGRNFRLQFKEEWDAAARDAGRFSLQALVHLGVRWGIVWSYSMMESSRQRRAGHGEETRRVTTEGTRNTKTD